MKRILPWLLVPVAAWLGHRSVPAPDAPAALPPPPPEKSPIVKEADALAETDPATLRQHAAGIFMEPDGREKRDRLRLVCARWAELDPAAGLAWAAEQDEDLALQLRLWILLEWALLDSAAAWASIPEGEEGDYHRHTVTGMLLHENPGIFMDWLRRLKQPVDGGNPAWQRIVERHAAELEEIAMTHLQEFENPQGGVSWDTRSLFSLLAPHRAEKNPAAALDWAAGLPESVKAFASYAVLDAWADSDPATAWKNLTALHAELSLSGGSRHAASDAVGAKILTLIGKDDPKAAMQLILDGNQRSVVFNLGGIEAMQSLVGTALSHGDLDPLEAYRLLSQAKGSASNLTLNVFPRIWHGLPPETLMTAARGILDEPAADYRGLALSGIASAWFSRDPQGAIDFIATIEDEGMRREMLVGGFRMDLGNQVDPQTQARRLTLVPENDRASVAASLMSAHGTPRAGTEGAYFHNFDSSQVDLLTPLLRDLPSSPDLNRAAETSAIVWAASSPSEALAWADSLNDPSARTAAYAGAFDTWAYHDPVSAATWLIEREHGPERDAATLPLVRRLGDSDPESGWAWAAAISDPALQNEARLAAIKAWSKQSPDDARAAFQDYVSTLPPAEAATFTQSLSAE